MKEAFDFIEFITESNKIEGVDLPKEDFSRNIYRKHPAIIGQINAIAHTSTLRYPLKIKDIKSIHYLLSKDSLAPEDAGEFRKVHVRVGPYIKVDPDLVMPMMKIFCRSFNEKSDPLENHYFFEVCHPFVDFNGRIGRILLITQQRLQKFPMTIIKI